MNSLKTIVFFLFFISTAFSQTNVVNDTILASQYFNKADSLMNDRKLDNAIVYFKKALPIYEKAKAWERVAGCYNGISNVNWNYKNDEESLKNSEKALEVFEKFSNIESIEKANAYENIARYYSFNTSNYETVIKNYIKALEVKSKIFDKNHVNIANIYSDIGIAYLDKGDTKKSLEFLLIAASIFDNLEGENLLKEAYTYTSLHRLYYDKGNLEKALKFEKRSLSILTEIYGINHIEVSYHYNDLALIYQRLGMYDKAIVNYKKLISILKKSSDSNLIKKALIYNNYGSLYKGLEDYPKALNFYKKALELSRKSNNEDVNSLIFNNIGFVLNEMGEYDKALNYCQKSLTIRRKIFSENHPFIAASHENLGYVFEKTKQFEIALSNYKIALNIFKDYFGNSNPYVANCFNNIANVYLKMGYFDEAISNYDSAFLSNSTPNDQSTGRQKFNPNNFLDYEILLLTFKGKVKAEKLKYTNNKNIDFLMNSGRTYQRADTIISYARQRLTSYKDKVIFGETGKDIYRSAIQAQLQLNKYGENSIPLKQAFYYSEKSRSNTLKDLLNDFNAKGFSGLSSKLIELEKDLRIDKAYYQSKINKQLSSKQIDSSKVSSYESELFDISRRQDSLMEILEKNYPKYNQLKYKNDVISVVEVQQKLDEKTTLLEFFTTDSTTYAFTISKNKIAVKELSTPQLDKQIEQFRSSVTKNYEEYKNISNQLYQTLVAPIKDELEGNQLIIVPDGPLWHLNFDLLLTEEDTSNNPKTWPYLLKEYAISYANSATLLFGDKVQEDADSKALQECLAFSFSSGDTISTTRNVSLKAFRSSSMDLPGTREEIRAIANIVDGEYFYGSEATEQNFKKHAGTYNILHLALHGDVDNERPENSKLYFTKSKDTLEDNYLYSHELFALDIPAELTVLSACNTGTGKIAKGEGIMSLGNAFQYAGTKSLLLTNWEVSDQTTPKIMEYFYTNLKDGKNKAEALQQAKLQFLTTTNQETDHPYYWGGFYLLGDSAAIQLQSDNYAYWFIGVGILALILVSLFWYRRKHSHLERN